MKKIFDFGKIAFSNPNRRANRVEVAVELRRDELSRPRFSAAATIYSQDNHSTVAGGQCLDELYPLSSQTRSSARYTGFGKTTISTTCMLARRSRKLSSWLIRKLILSTPSAKRSLALACSTSSMLGSLIAMDLAGSTVKSQLQISRRSRSFSRSKKLIILGNLSSS